MIKVATEYHHTSSDLNVLPAYKCTGTCKKVYWKDEFDPVPFGVLLHCEKCGGQLRSAKEGDDYNVLEREPGEKVMKGSSVTVKHVSDLQKQFIPLAKKYNWR